MPGLGVGGGQDVEHARDVAAGARALGERDRLTAVTKAGVAGGRQ
jgi:hypothetical protein